MEKPSKPEGSTIISWIIPILVLMLGWRVCYPYFAAVASNVG